jgi:hypothetical protein
MFDCHEGMLHEMAVFLNFIWESPMCYAKRYNGEDEDLQLMSRRIEDRAKRAKEKVPKFNFCVM